MGRAYAAERRPQIAVETVRGVVDAFIPRSHRPAAEAEVDSGDVKVWLAGAQVTCVVFAMRLSYSGKAVHRPVDRTTGVSYARARSLRSDVPDETEMAWITVW
jgi:hypothetical protein